MLIDIPLIDWVTFTSWRESCYLGWNKWLNLQDGEPVLGKIRMYEGSWCGSAFVGVGVQGGEFHAMARVSGASSHDAFCDLVQYGEAKCTRIDVQVTTLIPINFSSRKLVDDLRGKQDRDIRHIENSDGLNTVYIGSGSSDRFARIYVKELEGKRYLRFEVEHKREWAILVSEKYKADKTSLPGILNDFLQSVDVIDSQGIIPQFMALLGNIEAGLVYPYSVDDKNRTYQWILDQVTPAMVRLLNDHDIGPQLANHLHKLLEKNNWD